MKITKRQLRQIIRIAINEARNEESQLMGRFRKQELSHEEKRQLELRELEGQSLDPDEINYLKIEIDTVRKEVAAGTSKEEIIAILQEFFPDAEAREEAIYQYVIDSM